jgi:sigma-B regulation protein RsbU (phosphoserine phosphatase)
VTLSALLNSSHLRRQQTLLFVAIVIIAIFWVMGQQVNPLTIIVYSLLIGNLVAYPLDKSDRLFRDLRFPYDWLVFMGLVAVFTVPAYLLTTLVVYKVAPPGNVSLQNLLVHGWRFPLLVTVVYSVVIFLHQRTRYRLERRNLELQDAVQQRAAQIEVQEQELQRAQEIQQALLPKHVPQIPGFDVAGLWQPARLVGGDYYDVLALGNDRLGICIADVVGKGVSAALLMANVQAAVRAFAFDDQNPASLCTRLNRVMCDNIAEGKFVTFFYGVLDGSNRSLDYCNAGHLPPLLLNPRAITPLQQGGTVLGVFPEVQYQLGSVDLNPADRLVLFTDGLTEATAASGEEFGESGIANLARSSSEYGASALNHQLLQTVSTFCAGQFHDDATVLTVIAKDSQLPS